MYVQMVVLVMLSDVLWCIHDFFVILAQLLILSQYLGLYLVLLTDFAASPHLFLILAKKFFLQIPTRTNLNSVLS